MYQRKRKDNFSKKIKQMIIGRNKRSCNEIGINNISNINDGTNINDNTNINSDTNINGGTNINGDTNINGGTNINDNNSIGDSNYSNDNSHRNDHNKDINRINSSPGKNRVTSARWIPSNKKIEGIRKFG